MPPKKVINLMNEKVAVLTAIRQETVRRSLKDTEPAKFAKNTGTVGKACGLTKEQLTDPDTRKKVEDLAAKIEKAKNRYEHDVKALSFYKAAVLSHRKLAESTAVTNEMKELSLAQLKLYESELKKAGIDENVIEASILFPDFDQRLQSLYGKELHAELKDAAAQNGWEYAPVEAASESAFIRTTGEDERIAPKVDYLLADEDIEVHEMFAKTGVNYFKNYRETDDSYSLTETQTYKCFEFRNGEYVEKESPNGFFAKIGYFFTKLFNKSSERQAIEREKEFAARELDSVPEDVRNGGLIADLEDLAPTEEEWKALEENLEKDTSLVDKFLEQQAANDAAVAENVAEGPIKEGPGLDEID